MNPFPCPGRPGQNARSLTPSRGFRRLSQLTVGVLGVLLALAWNQPADRAEPILSWPGAERDPHPCLYVTAKDLARFKAAARNLQELTAQKNFNLGGGLEQAVTAALLTANPAAERTVLQGALTALDTLLANIPRTRRDNVGPHAYSQHFGQAVGLADAALAAQSTDVSASWDDDALEVSFLCADNGIVAAVQDNDNIKLWRDDSVYVWLDPCHTHNSDKQFIMIQVSASGAWHDLKNGDPAFNVQGLKGDVARTAKGWSARLRIPWKGMGEAAPKPGDVWGVNFTRMDQPGRWTI